MPVPALDVLERLSARTLAASLAALAAGIGIGLVDLVREGGGVDVAMAATMAALAAYATLAGLERRAARSTIAAFTLALLTLGLAHFA